MQIPSMWVRSLYHTQVNHDAVSFRVPPRIHGYCPMPARLYILCIPDHVQFFDANHGWAEMAPNNIIDMLKMLWQHLHTCMASIMHAILN